MSTAECTLVDGRTLAYRQYGVPDGFPVFFFHGNLNSRLFEPAWEKTEAQTVAAGARVIAVDRPGYGLSSFLPTRTYGSWAQDVSQLARHLSLPAYAVLGYSSGGPNAMVCAAAACGGVPGTAPAAESGSEAICPRLAACGLIAPDGPYLVIGVDSMKRMFGTESSPTPEVMGLGIEKSYNNLKESYESMSKEDRRVVALADLAEATRQGRAAAEQDGLLEGGDWGFTVSSIQTAVVPMLLWHGEADEAVPVTTGRWISEAIPGCRATFIEGESHTLLRRHWQPFLEQLVAAAQSGITDAK